MFQLHNSRLGTAAVRSTGRNERTKIEENIRFNVKHLFRSVFQIRQGEEGRKGKFRRAERGKCAVAASLLHRRGGKSEFFVGSAECRLSVGFPCRAAPLDGRINGRLMLSDG